MKSKIGFALLALLFFTNGLPLLAQKSTTHVFNDSIMITIFLKHQQDKNLESLQKIQQKNKFAERFPPKSARVISWYVMMGIGQVVTVRIPASQLRTLNLALEQGAWGAFETEFYPTYDYVPVWQESLKPKTKPKK